MKNYAYRTETRTSNGYKFRVEWFDDNDSGAPWENCDGHGPVSDWEHRDKKPGEMILIEDRGFKRFYDFAEAVKQARREGWNCAPYNFDTKGAQAAAAAYEDYDFLRRWCTGYWHYCGIVVTLLDDEGEESPANVSESLWGMEEGLPESDRYHEEMIDELMQECLLDINRQTFAGSSVGV